MIFYIKQYKDYLMTLCCCSPDPVPDVALVPNEALIEAKSENRSEGMRTPKIV